ncbi:Protein-lysine N-methyltransferase EFM1 [Fusarium oxysporum f. sp. albedinis]|nr:Protein-lysine N-methyltransferase EFM1 [Fusarium oxysporum f. sp. albedinis]
MHKLWPKKLSSSYSQNPKHVTQVRNRVRQQPSNMSGSPQSTLKWFDLSLVRIYRSNDGSSKRQNSIGETPEQQKQQIC